MPETTLADEMDAENRMVSATPVAPTGGSLRVVNRYGYRNRRIRKDVEAWVPQGPGFPLNPGDAAHWETARRHDFVYDGWLPVCETVTTYTNGTAASSEEIGYVWGRDLSGSLQGAGGVGCQVAVLRGGQYYFPAYDNLGNVTEYIDESGLVVARYRYGAFGELLSASGPMAASLHLLFSTKYLDQETSLYYYGERFYAPILGRWLNRDPIGEEGGVNLYGFCGNNSIYQIDRLGLYLWYVLYYDEPNNGDGNFKRAAETCKNNIERLSHFNSKCDSVEVYGIQTRNEFIRVWTTLNAHSRRKSKRVTRCQVKGLYLFTHSGAGKLYLHNSTAQASQIKKLPVLNWASKAEIQCLGCNSGVENDSGDSLAGSFYESQKVPSIGQSGSSSFSSDPNKKSKWGVVLGFSDVYLWAFDENGNKMPPIQYPKKQEDSR